MPACHAPPLLGIGRSTETPGTRATDGGASDAAAVSPVPADFAARYGRVGPDSFVAFGHAAGRYAATVYVSPEGKDVALGSARPVPAGTMVVMVDVERSTHRPGPTYFMQRQAGDAGAWTYGVVELPGLTPADVSLCARCHEEAPHDGLFALPE